jgi:pimeloyl-ACP methyl ester carboxylesterase
MKKSEFLRWFGLTATLGSTLKSFEKIRHNLPVLFVSGRQDHMFIEDVKKMAKLEPKGTMIIVENCGHIVNIEQAEEFNGISLNWLRNLPL